MQLYFVCTFWHELILNNINPPNFYPQVPPITLQSTHHISLHTWKLQSNETVTKKNYQSFSPDTGLKHMLPTQENTLLQGLHRPWVPNLKIIVGFDSNAL